MPADSLFSENGTRGGMVGIAPVPPDRLPGPLPEGLKFPVVITVQSTGTNFDKPAPVCFPNLPDPDLGTPLPGGTKSWLYSYDHDQGKWVPIGPMTVTEDARLVCTDPGVGIRAPGWHGSGPPPLTPPLPPPCPTPGGVPFVAPLLPELQAASGPVLLQAGSAPTCPGCTRDQTAFLQCQDDVQDTFIECQIAPALAVGVGFATCLETVGLGCVAGFIGGLAASGFCDYLANRNQTKCYKLQV